MKVMSYNIAHCEHELTGKIDFEAIAKVITDLGADIVGLNEVRGKGPRPDYEDQARILSELTGMKYFYFAKALDNPSRGSYGNAFLSKIPIVKAETIMIPDPTERIYKRAYETRCVLKAELEGGITVLVTHFGLNPDEHENAAKTIFDNIVDNKCIAMGDFNVLPDDPVLDPIKNNMCDTADVFETETFSFPSSGPIKKIDYIFVSDDVKVLDADIPALVVSDHCPYVATLDI